MSKVLSTCVSDEIAQVIEDYAIANRLSVSHVFREIIIGELSLSLIKSKLQPEGSEK